MLYKEPPPPEKSPSRKDSGTETACYIGNSIVLLVIV